MFRPLVRFALGIAFALALIGPVAAQTPSPARPTLPPVKPAAERKEEVRSSYAVYSRRPGDTTWTNRGTFPTHEAARTAAQGFYRDGLEVQVHTITTLARVPARPKVAKFDVQKTVTPQQAGEVYRWMAGQTDIAFRYVPDGCYARAHLMIERMKGRNLHPYKVWSFANGESLYARTKSHPDGHVTWRYHVAPVLRVRFSDDSQTWVVIDPSLHTGPMTINQWKKAQTRPGATYQPYITLTRLGEAPKDATGTRLPGTGYWPGPDPREGLTAHAVKTMRTYKPYEGRASAPAVALLDGLLFGPTQRPELALIDLWRPALAA